MTYIDPVKVSSKQYKVLLENDDVRVLEMSLKAGDKDTQHSHPSETVYFVNGGKVKIYLEDGGVVDADIPNGHVMWNGPWTHTVENVGTSDIYAIIVESKK